MEKSTAQFLEFNGKRINVLTADGQWWVAVKPICDALSIDFKAQHKRLISDKILSRVSSKQTTHDASNRLQEMFCIREKFVYGWLFSIQSDSEELTEFKLECYETLYNHFHAPLTGRMTTLSEKSAIDIEIEDLESKLQESEEYKRIQELKKRKTTLSAKLRQMDKDLVARQLTLAF